LFLKKSNKNGERLDKKLPKCRKSGIISYPREKLRTQTGMPNPVKIKEKVTFL
jgi:hypothetical protein